MKLIYCSYPLMDAEVQVDWIDKLAKNPVARKENWAIYNPRLGFVENFETDPYRAVAMTDPGRISEKAKALAEPLQLDPMLFLPFPEVQHRLAAADRAPTVDVPFKDLYVILRSDIVLADISNANHGEDQAVMYAHLLGIPVVAISHRFIMSPWIVGKVSSVIFPKTSDEIVQQVLAFDHKTAAMVKYYRAIAQAEEKAAEDTRRAEEASASAQNAPPAGIKPGAFKDALAKAKQEKAEQREAAGNSNGSKKPKLETGSATLPTRPEEPDNGITRPSDI